MTEIRLHVLLSRAGFASRRKAEALIKEGRVQVNNRVVTTLGAKADPERDSVSVDGVSVGDRQPPTTMVLNKPVEVVTTLSDPEQRETVADLVADEPYRFLPVGRLDYHTEGLLLMTTDGELSHRLLHPRYHVPKVYQVKVRGRPDRPAIDRLREGVPLDDGPTRPAVVEVLEEGHRWTWLEIVVAEGRNRLVRRMCDEVGHPALRVVRTELATIGLGGLKPGQFRYLNPSELAALYQTADLPVPTELPARAHDAQRLVLGAARRGKGPLPSDPPPKRKDPGKDPRNGPATQDRGPRAGHRADGATPEVYKGAPARGRRPSTGGRPAGREPDRRDRRSAGSSEGRRPSSRGRDRPVRASDGPPRDRRARDFEDGRRARVQSDRPERAPRSDRTDHAGGRGRDRRSSEAVGRRSEPRGGGRPSGRRGDGARGGGRSLNRSSAGPAGRRPRDRAATGPEGRRTARSDARSSDRRFEGRDGDAARAERPRRGSARPRDDGGRGRGDRASGRTSGTDLTARAGGRAGRGGQPRGQSGRPRGRGGQPRAGGDRAGHPRSDRTGSGRGRPSGRGRGAGRTGRGRPRTTGPRSR